MNRFIDRLFDGRPHWVVVLAALFMLSIIGLLDYLSGEEISLFIFFAIPVVLATWYTNKNLGYCICITAILTWAYADKMTGHVYSHAWIRYWNGGIRLIFFLMAAQWTSNIKSFVALQSRLAHVDGLTGCLNAYAFNEKCDTLFPLSYRLKQPVSLGFIDLDNFKNINDTRGHSEGNRILKTVADVMLKSVRSTDIVGRIGGDEFAILLPNTDIESARKVIGHLMSQLSGEVECIECEKPLGFSCGVVTFRSQSITTDRALALADSLMYEVKKRGKNSVLYEIAPDTGTNPAS